MNEKSRVLLVEDEKSLQDVLILNLQLDNYDVTFAEDGKAALDVIQEKTFDIIILDVMLPYLSGFDVCRKVRSIGIETPILFLTARGSDEDRVEGLRIGGDDYLVKPFNLDEFLLRVQRIISRTKNSLTNNNTVRIGDAIVDFKSYTISLNGLSNDLTKKECLILKLLYDKKNTVVSRDEILNSIWGEEAYPSNRTVDNIIVNIRKYIEKDTKNPVYLQSVRGVGYKLCL